MIEPFTMFSENGTSWAIDSIRVAKGSYSLRSSNITHNQQSSIETIVNSAGGLLRFGVSVSSEGCCDKVRFYIDDVEQGVWSGEESFITYRMQLSAGMHKLKWVYSKDGSANIGEDAAWLDELFVPAVPDSDNDGVEDALEYRYFNSLDADLMLDTDGDGLTDGLELEYETNPLVVTDLVADAGKDMVTFGTVETPLNGIGIVRTGASIVSYLWEQIGGEPTTLLQANQATATFIVPDVMSERMVQFKLTVTDSSGNIATNTVNVTVKPYSEFNVAPSVAESQEVLVSAGEAVSVMLAANDGDNDPLTYSWIQTSGDTVNLNSPMTNTLRFTAPTATTNKAFSFKLAVSDGNYTVERSVIVAVKAIKASSGMYFYHNDHLGTPQVMTDENANIVWRAEYKPFGGADITVETITNNIRFAGQYYDQETGLHYNYFRDYDPSLGRYLQSDPMGLYDGVNTYAYVGNNPLMYIDPYGLWRIGDPLPQWMVDGAAGWGGVLSFGLTNQINNALGTSHTYSQCSAAYKGGQALGMVNSLAFGGAAASRSAVKTGIPQFSHAAFPNRYLKQFSNPVAKWLNKKGNLLNGQYVSWQLHAKVDPWAYRFTARSWKALNKPYSNFRQAINRVPYLPGAGLYGAGGAAISSSNCGCGP